MSKKISELEEVISLNLQGQGHTQYNCIFDLFKWQYKMKFGWRKHLRVWVLVKITLFYNYSNATSKWLAECLVLVTRLIKLNSLLLGGRGSCQSQRETGSVWHEKQSSFRRMQQDEKPVRRAFTRQGGGYFCWYCSNKQTPYSLYKIIILPCYERLGMERENRETVGMNNQQ